MRMVSIATALVVGMWAAVALTGETPSVPGAEVYFVNVEDGAKVDSPFTIVFGLKCMGIAPAGIEQEGTGHHHLLIDRPPFGQGEDGEEEYIYSIPADDHHKHLGGGQTETELDLAPGTHTLQLILADHNHIPHDPPVVSEVITITVE